MKPNLIVIDGKTYNSVDEMPDDVRRLYEQAMSSFKAEADGRASDATEVRNPLSDDNRNGIPDKFENSRGGPIVANALKVLFDGHEYTSIDDLPPEARSKYEQAMGTLDANHNGIPDFVGGMLSGSVQSSQQSAPMISTSFGHDTTHHAARQPMPVSPTIEPDRPNGWLLALLAAVLFFGCVAAAAGVWYFFLR